MQPATARAKNAAHLIHWKTTTSCLAKTAAMLISHQEVIRCPDQYCDSSNQIIVGLAVANEKGNTTD